MSQPLGYKDIINSLEGKDGAYWQKMLMELTLKNKAATPSDVHEAVKMERLPLNLYTTIPEAQRIHLDEKFLAEYRSKHPEFRYGALGEVTYKRTYARTVNWITRKKESWFDTVKRVVEGTLYIQQCHCAHNDLGFDAEERLQNFGRPLFDSIFNFRMLPPGRGLWAMGTENVETKGFASLFNCAFISTERMGDPDYDIVTPFLFMMDMSMLGVGVGFDTKGSTKSLTIYRPKNRFYKLDDRGILKTIHHKVEDSREGWVNSLRAVLEAYLKPDHDLPLFDYEDVRPCGVPIKKFGGTTSGPVPLREMHDELIKVLDKFAGMTLTSDELFTEFGLKGVSLLSTLILDIMNIIGNCVVSGNVRRSAQIAFGDPDDDRFRTLKDWRDPRNAYRAGYMYASNNSYLFEKRHTDKGDVYLSQKFLEVEESLLLNGEPGVMFLEAARAYSRMADAPNYKDAKACGSNPCVEQTLHDGELCVSGDTCLQTRDGIFKISDLIGKEVQIWNGKKWSKVVPSITGYNKELFRVNMSDGSHLDCTGYHGWSIETSRHKGVAHYKRIQTQNLKAGMKVQEFELGTGDIRGKHVDEAFAWGLFAGDGYIDRDIPVIMAYGPKTQWKNLELGGTWGELRQRDGYADPMARWSLRDVLDTNTARKLNDKTAGIPEFFFDMDKESVFNFVAGWIESDGSVSKQAGSEHYRIYGSKQKMLDLQVLLRRVGVNHASVTMFASAGEVTNFGKRNHDLYYLTIPSYECAEIPTHFKKVTKIGSRMRQNNAHPNGTLIDSAKRQKIISVEKLDGLHTTYCFTEPEEHLGVFNNVLTHQCNLVETFIAKMKDKSEFLRTLMLAFEFAKTVTLGSIHWKITDDIVAKNRRIGTSISGIIDFLDMFDMDILKDWLDTGYQFLQFFDCWLSQRMCIPMSIKTTSIKPSGTVSLVAGASPGMHPPHSRFYIRHVRFSPDSELLKPLEEAGYRIVWNIKGRNPDGTPVLDYRSKVVAFPIDEGKHVKTTKENFSMKQQFELLVLIQKWWADNQVSVTITYDRKKEGHQIHKMLMEHYNEVKAVSFLENEKGTYDLMPYEEITEEQYLKEAAYLKPVQWDLVEPTTPQCMEDEETDNYCDGGACMISRKFTPSVVAEATMEDVEDPGNMFCDGDSCQLPPRSQKMIDKKRKRDDITAGSQEREDEISSDTESSSSGDEASAPAAAKKQRT